MSTSSGCLTIMPFTAFSNCRPNITLNKWKLWIWLLMTFWPTPTLGTPLAFSNAFEAKIELVDGSLPWRNSGIFAALNARWWWWWIWKIITVGVEAYIFIITGWRGNSLIAQPLACIFAELKKNCSIVWSLRVQAMALHANTAWCSEIGSLTSLDAPELHASSDVREPISLHQAVDAFP